MYNMRTLFFIILATFASISFGQQTCTSDARFYVNLNIIPNGNQSITGAKANEAFNLLLDAIECDTTDTPRRVVDSTVIVGDSMIVIASNGTVASRKRYSYKIATSGGGGTDTQSLYLTLLPDNFKLGITRGNELTLPYTVDFVYVVGDSMIVEKYGPPDQKRLAYVLPGGGKIETDSLEVYSDTIRPGGPGLYELVGIRKKGEPFEAGGLNIGMYRDVDNNGRPTAVLGNQQYSLQVDETGMTIQPGGQDNDAVTVYGKDEHDKVVSISKDPGKIITEAPNDGSEYVRKNNTWIVASGGGGGGSISLTQNHFAIGNNSNELSDGGPGLTYNEYELYFGRNSNDTGSLYFSDNGSGTAFINMSNCAIGDIYDKQLGIQSAIDPGQARHTFTGRSDYNAIINHTGSGDISALNFTYNSHLVDKTYIITLTDSLPLIQISFSAPTVFISGENFITNTGTTGTIAYSFDPGNTMSIKDVVGDINYGDTIFGLTSGNIADVTFVLPNMITYTYDSGDTIVYDIPITVSTPFPFSINGSFSIRQSHPLTIGDQWTVEIKQGHVGGIYLDYRADQFSFGNTAGVGNATNIKIDDRNSKILITCADSSAGLTGTKDYSLKTTDLDYFQKIYLSHIDKSLIPADDVTYDLGSPSFRWNDLYLNGSTMYLGDDVVRTTDGHITVNSNKVYQVGDTLLQAVKGSTTFSGVTLQTTYTVTHGLSFTPSAIFPQARSAAAAAFNYITNITSTTFDIVFLAVPTLGTNNILFDWIAYK